MLHEQAAAVSEGWAHGVPTLVIVPGDDRLVDAAASLRWACEQGGAVEVSTRKHGRHELHNDLDRTEALAAIADWLDPRVGFEPPDAGRVLAGGRDPGASATKANQER